MILFEALVVQEAKSWIVRCEASLECGNTGKRSIVLLINYSR